MTTEARTPNARRFARHAVRVPVYISVAEGIFRKTVHLHSKDVSGGGLCFETRRELPLDLETRVVVARLGELGPGALIRGRVAHREKDPTSGRYSVGVEFTEFVGASQQELLARLELWKPPAA
jgi:c-di-GMP-binding flagellar brake protein YcgR